MFRGKTGTDKICVNCGKPFKGSHNQLYCTKACKPVTYRSLPSKVLNIPKGTIGAVSELMVCVDLMKRGWEVFRATSPHSYCDVLALKNGQLLKLEVRTGFYYKKDNSPNVVAYSKRRTDDKSVAVVTLADNKIHYIDFEP